MRPTLEERFWAKVDKTPGHGPEGECWVWTACRNPDGYGKVSVNGRVVGAHRAAWERDNGPVPEGLCVLHRCDVPACVNPSHLFLGSHQENMRDREAKGRGGYGHMTGEAHGCAKLSESDVRDIRAAYAAGGCFQRELAQRYGVYQTVISKIVRGKLWKQVA